MEKKFGASLMGDDRVNELDLFSPYSQKVFNQFILCSSMGQDIREKFIQVIEDRIFQSREWIKKGINIDGNQKFVDEMAPFIVKFRNL